MKFTGERIIPNNSQEIADEILYLRHLFAYEYVLKNDLSSLKILEVGCGEGYGSALLAKNSKIVYGLDNNEVTVDHAKNKYESKKCKFKLYDGKIIPFDDSSFDVVISYQVIEHVENVNQYLGEISRVLFKNGKFYCTTPNRSYRLYFGQKPWNKFHLKEYYSNDLKKDLKKHFSEVKLYGISGNQSIQKIEKDRVLEYKIFSLRQPLTFLLNIIFIVQDRIYLRALKKSKNISDDSLKRSSFSLKDYHIHEQNLSSSLDLFAIAEK